jgi:hypothetical protein
MFKVIEVKKYDSLVEIKLLAFDRALFNEPCHLVPGDAQVIGRPL